jgi:hypothetical protein
VSGDHSATINLIGDLPTGVTGFTLETEATGGGSLEPGKGLRGDDIGPVRSYALSATGLFPLTVYPLHSGWELRIHLVFRDVGGNAIASTQWKTFKTTGSSTEVTPGVPVPPATKPSTLPATNPTTTTSTTRPVIQIIGDPDLVDIRVGKPQ